MWTRKIQLSDVLLLLTSIRRLCRAWMSFLLPQELRSTGGAAVWLHVATVITIISLDWSFHMVSTIAVNI